MNANQPDDAARSQTPEDVIIGLLQSAGNRLLEFDPETRERLAQLEGRVFKVELSIVDRDLYLIPSRDGMLIKREWPGVVDITLRGSPLAFTQFGLRQRGLDKQAFADKRVMIEGDAELAQDLQRLLAALDLDLEEMLSRYIGDVAARQVGRGFRAMRAWVRDAASSLEQDIREYMVEESRVLAPPWRVDGFIERVDGLRADVERLEQRIDRLVRASAHGPS